MSYGLSHAQGESLAQSRPADTAQYTIYTGGELRTELTRIAVCNNTASPVGFRMYHVLSGDSASLDNAIFYGKSVPANDTILIDAPAVGSGFMLNKDEKIIVESLTGDALAFHLYGITETLADRVRPAVN